MKKVVLIFILLLSAAVGLLYVSSGGGGRIPAGIGSVTSSDTRFLKKRTIDFLEDIQFKDFKKAATYHDRADRSKVDISKLIERLFGVKPEFLDIMRYEIKDVDIDRSGDRGRVKTDTVVKFLNTGKIKKPQIIFYWKKDPKEGWVMKLESSLH